MGNSFNNEKVARTLFSERNLALKYNSQLKAAGNGAYYASIKRAWLS